MDRGKALDKFNRTKWGYEPEPGIRRRIQTDDVYAAVTGGVVSYRWGVAVGVDEGAVIGTGHTDSLYSAMRAARRFVREHLAGNGSAGGGE